MMIVWQCVNLGREEQSYSSNGFIRDVEVFSNLVHSNTQHYGLREGILGFGALPQFGRVYMICYSGLFVVIMDFGGKDINSYSFIDNLIDHAMLLVNSS